MDGFVGLLAIVGLILALYYFRKISSGFIPRTSETQINKFKDDIPKEFNDYVYCLDCSGVAFDLVNDRVLLMENNRRKIYSREEIRDAETSIAGAREWYYSGGSLLNKAVGKFNTALDNRVERRKAYAESGLFVQVADIDHPVWQIRFSDERQLQKYAEIFRQFFEGTLKPRAEKMTPHAAKPGFCPHCGADCREYPQAVACHVCHKYFDEGHRPLEQ